MCLAQGPQRSDAGEARTRGPTVSIQALYHWATALPKNGLVLLGQISKWKCVIANWFSTRLVVGAQKNCLIERVLSGTKIIW